MLFALIATQNLDVQTAIAGDDKIDVGQLQVAGERIDGLVEIDLFAKWVEARFRLKIGHYRLDVGFGGRCSKQKNRCHTGDDQRAGISFHEPKDARTSS